MARPLDPAQFVARRFLLSPKSHSIINVMSWVSVVAVGVPVAAMVILMSVFNGFDAIVRNMHSDFEPEITLLPERGAVMACDDSLCQKVVTLDDVAAASWVLDGEALLAYHGRQTTATVRGVDSEFTNLVPIEDMMTAGDYALCDAWGDCAVVGRGLGYELGIRGGRTDSVRMYVPSRGRYSKLMPTAGVNTAGARPVGIFALDADTDGTYILVSLSQAQQLFDYPASASALKVRLAAGADCQKVCDQISKFAPQGVVVRTREQLSSAMYKVLDYEKLAIVLIGVMILIVASFSVVGTLTMLKGLPLAYNKDMQEDKESIFDALDTVKMCLGVFTPMVQTMKIRRENMYAAAQKGFINATDLADYLTKKGIPFRTAYKLTGELVAYCIAANTVLEKLPLEFLQSKHPAFEEDVYGEIALETCVAKRISAGSTSYDSVKSQIAFLRSWLEETV